MEKRLTPTTLPTGFTEAAVVSGLSNPTAMEFAPDGRLFALEQGGNVKLVHGDGTTWTALHLSVDSQGERGLLGIAFDPNFSTNHYAYIYDTNPNAGASYANAEHNQLSRFTVNDANPQQPVFGNEAPILDWNNLSGATNHNGGAIHFGSDGMLYADAGDNVQTFTQGGNTYRVSQTLSNLLGKQLRINVAQFNAGIATRDDPTVGRLIPTDNPFVGTASGVNQLIYALGLRNPYTFAVQPGTGKIFINDVGESTWEEIDQSIAGGNYGWSGGNTDGFGQSPPGPGMYHDPLLAYNHSGGPAGGGNAIVGGTFYNPANPQFPSSYIGKYFYEDLSTGWIRVFDPAHPGSAANPDTSTSFATGTPGSLRDLKVDSAGNLYYLSGNGGVINKISYSAPQTTSVVVDDRDAGYTESGTGWLNYPLSGYNGDVHYHYAGSGADTATWQVPGLTAGAYVVQAAWSPPAPDHATNATYRIYDGSTLLATVPVNQQVNSSGVVVAGTSFQTLATVSVSGSNPLRVALGDDANGIVVADAVRVVAATSRPAIVDNGAAGYAETGPWLNYPAGYNGSLRYTQTGTGATATWQETGLAVGTYSVQTTWLGAPDHAPDATYQIYDGTTLVQTVAVDQRSTPIGPSYGGVPFQSLATVPISGGTLRVVLKAASDSIVVADAVRIA